MILLQALLSPIYRFPEGKPIPYRAEMKFDGYLPILGVGKGKAEVIGQFDVTGAAQSKAEVKLQGFTVTFNGEKIPIDLDDARKYVPGGTFAYTSAGAVSGWDAPTVTAPIRVPGLDLKHLPEVLFLPIEFPAVGVESGKQFKFSLPLSGGDAEFGVTPTRLGPDHLDFALTLHQTYSNFEDDANQVVDKKDAVARVSTEVDGKGTASFSVTLGRFTRFEITDTALSTVTDLDTKKVTTRKLTRMLLVTS